MEDDILKADIQQNNSKVPPHLLPFAYKEGQSGNPNGRPKGKTLKEYCRDFLAKMTDEEREEFLNGLPKEIIWRMAEGNPKQDTELSGEVKMNPIYGNKSISGYNGNSEGISVKKED